MKYLSRLYLLSFSIICFFPVIGAAQASNSGRQLAAPSAEGGAIRWHPGIEYSHLVLTVTQPDGKVSRKEFKGGQEASFSLTDENGYALPDGHYTYELRIVPNIPPEITRILEESREQGNSDQLVRELKTRGILPSEPMVQSGSFVVSRGAAFVGAPGESVEPESHVTPRTKNNVARSVVTPEDQVVADDEIIQGSLCVGLDCLDKESFGFDTIRLKENNTRIKFNDTSTSTGFPANNWQLTANDSASGGANKFSIDDVTGGKTPFTILAGAPTNSLFVDSAGRLGLGTSTPVLKLHENQSDTPAIRLEQNSGGGFTAQTWDIGANEANFFVRDVTGGSRLPLRIRPGAPTSSIDISSTGSVGIGTASPGANLDVHKDVDDGVIALVENLSNTANSRAVMRVGSNTAGGLLSAHADARVLSRYGVNLGGWVEIQQFAGNGLAIGTLGAAPMILGVNSTDALHITPTGNVGIGTATPGGKLDVNGQIFQRGSLLHADYVFEPSYKLESVENHADYMWKNKHLPAVPARKVDAEGREVVEVGAEQRGILEELEKAHIYIEKINDKIAQRDGEVARLAKIVEDQQKMIAELSKKVSRLRSSGKLRTK